MRKLTEKEIECRINTVSAKGCSILLYKDARVDQRILDEEYGPLGWQRSHQLIGDRLYCTVSVWDEEKKQWISKQDVGTESNAEKEKGQASDSFKRACFNFGIGRELYTAPFIWVPLENVTLSEKGKDNYGKPKYTTYDKFAVTQIIYENDCIAALAIKNISLGKMAFVMDNRKKK